MLKKEGKKRASVFLFLILVSLLLIEIVSATDVGYILKSKSKVNKNILSVFNEMGLSYELITDSKIKNYDLSKYRFLFVDNVRLVNTRKIPIYNYPSVIMNGYHGAEWGLTDKDGLSQLSADQPLKVRLVNDGLNQVYTKAQVNGKYLFYYYLSDKNCRLNNFQTVARTWTGNVDTNDIGDVISVAPAGTTLMNGAISNGNLCFYGIANTKYWTPEARELFMQCVGYVSSMCSNDEQCPSDETSN
ncbi:MAG: hypothetical protein PHF67_03540, partial [Candidatus Nanoarchaeia archaeon]|nr:hypothetical protein [Candidatus Nanoarchaeia archaeon]